MNRLIPLVCALCAVATVPMRLTGQKTYADREEWWAEAPDGCSLYVAEYGKGNPIVFVHGGFGAEHSYLLDAVQGLEKMFHLVFYDQRGSLRSPANVYRTGGSRPCPDSLITVNNHVEDLERLRVALGRDKLDLVAHSMGAYLALSYLERYPSRVGRLVLVAPYGLRMPQDSVQRVDFQRRLQAAQQALFARAELAATLAREHLDHPGLSGRERFDEWRIRFAAANLYHIERWRSLHGGMAFQNERAGMAASRSMPASWDFVDDLTARQSPTTIIMGDHDFADFGATMYRQWLSKLPQVKLVVLKDAGHMVWMDQPKRFRRELLHALRE
jgi:proline iminopeptidase